MTTKFLSGNEITTEIINILSGSQRADLAVAFWGAGAVERLSLSQIKVPLRIICDLRSGACNPDELLKLIERNATEVRATDGLHAKVYMTPGGMVVGSANASANGLGEEDNEVDAHLEAAVLVDQQDVVNAASKWFERQWTSASRVDKNKIEEAKAEWERRRRERPRRNAGTSLLAKLDASPKWFQDRKIRLYCYEYRGISKGAEKTFQRIANERFGKERAENYENGGLYPLYEDASDWDVQEGEYVLDFEIVNGKVKRSGLWQIRQGENWFERIKESRTKRIILADEVKSAFGMKFTKADQKALALRIQESMNRGIVAVDPHGDLIDASLSDLYTKHPYLRSDVVVGQK